ncbi:early growth response protein 4-like [Salvelinus namaycush]|uniref:Early growth response protein 4-like n=1 Tax=Salvelinus namaycush TaxID=8040 RepID=A0A8U0R4J4_SALNM|nr:early growth response protein 4-like [Salvelinus namaycush]
MDLNSKDSFYPQFENCNGSSLGMENSARKDTQEMFSDAERGAPAQFTHEGAPVTLKTEASNSDFAFNPCEAPKGSYSSSLAYSGSFYVEATQGGPCSTETLLNMITEIVGISTLPISEVQLSTMDSSSFGDAGVQRQSSTCSATPPLYSPGQTCPSYPDGQSGGQAQDSASPQVSFGSPAQVRNQNSTTEPQDGVQS